MRTRPLLLSFVLLGLAGCAGVFGFEELTDIDSRQPDGSSGNEPDGSNASDAATVAIADFYVSPLGDDAADGSSQRPLRTVRKAVDRATGGLLGGQPQRIAVCAGDYPEQTLVVRGAITISGSYDCQTWTRAELVDTPVGPSLEPNSHLTDIDANADAFISMAGDATGTPRLEGLDIVASSASGAVTVNGATSVRHCQLTNQALPRAAGLFVTSAIVMGGPNNAVEHCTLTVRQPDEAAGKGGIGIGVSSGPQSVRRNLVNVMNVNGRGMGILAGEKAQIDLTENRFYLGGGMESLENGTTSVGVYLLDANVRSTRNVVQIETPGHSQSLTQVLGFASIMPSRLVSDGDRVIGPTTLRPDAKEKVLRFAGFYDEDALESVVNASILLVASPQIAIEETSGIRLSAHSRAYIAHNTMYLAGKEHVTDAGTPDPPAYGVNLSTTPPSMVTFDANLVILGNPEMRVVRGRCGTTQFVSLARNRHAGDSLPGASPSCGNGVQLDALWPGADQPENDNAVVTCEGSCAALVDTDLGHVFNVGLKLTAQGCAAALRVDAGMVANDADAGDADAGAHVRVTVDGTGAERIGPTTYAGAFANCP